VGTALFSQHSDIYKTCVYLKMEINGIHKLHRNNLEVVKTNLNLLN
jgi:hypothetical protein